MKKSGLWISGLVHDRRQIGVNQAQVYTVPPSVVHQVACLPWTPDGPRICRSGGTTPARGSKGSILEFWVVGANRLQFRVNNPPTSTAQPLGSSNGRGWRSLAAWAGPALCLALWRALCGTKLELQPQRAIRVRRLGSCCQCRLVAHARRTQHTSEARHGSAHCAAHTGGHRTAQS